MANMSYCRFHNTAIDLADCDEALDALIACDPSAKVLSEDELRAAKRLVKLCQNIIGNLTNHVELDPDRDEDPLDYDFDADLEKINADNDTEEGGAQ